MGESKLDFVDTKELIKTIAAVGSVKGFGLWEKLHAALKELERLRAEKLALAHERNEAENLVELIKQERNDLHTRVAELEADGKQLRSIIIEQYETPLPPLGAHLVTSQDIANAYTLGGRVLVSRLTAAIKWYEREIPEEPSSR